MTTFPIPVYKLQHFSLPLLSWVEQFTD